MNTLLQLSNSIRSQIWSENEAENLVESHNQLFLEALAQIQRNVPCEREQNANVIAFCNSFFKCGLSVVPAPRGIIKWVYTIANDDWCDPVMYEMRSLSEVQCYRSNCRTYENPENAGQPVFPLGFKKAESTTDSDQGRARCGIFAIDNGNLFLAPWIQSNEKIVIEWSGEKDASQWSDDDPVSDAIDFRTAIKLWVQYAHERDYGDATLALTFHNPQRTGTFDEALADVMLNCREQTRLRKLDNCHRRPTWAQIEDDAVPT